MRRREVKPRQAAELKKPIAAEHVLRLQLSSPVGVVISLVLEGPPLNTHTCNANPEHCAPEVQAARQACRQARLDAIYRSIDPRYRDRWATWVISLRLDREPARDRSVKSQPSVARCPWCRRMSRSAN